MNLCPMESRTASFGSKAILPVIWIFIMLLFGVWVLYTGRYESFISLTASHSAFGNFFFRYVTHLGDGIFILALAAFLAIIKRYYLSIGIVAGYLLSGLFAQLGKRLLNAPRPKAFFESMGETVYQVPGVEVHLAGSFPSGHTASAFALAVFLMLALPNRLLGFIFLILACLVGYSRIYLSQHFPLDVWAGAMIGTFSGVFVYWRMKKTQG
jgi:membrane-associated phospholipid phosphatase